MTPRIYVTTNKDFDKWTEQLRSNATVPSFEQTLFSTSVIIDLDELPHSFAARFSLAVEVESEGEKVDLKYIELVFDRHEWAAFKTYVDSILSEESEQVACGKIKYSQGQEND